MLLTRPPLIHLLSFRRNPLNFIARLACVRRAASVRPEPGSNSQLKFLIWFALLSLLLTFSAKLVLLVFIHHLTLFNYQGFLLSSDNFFIILS